MKLINIGRSSKNDVVLNDVSVSRHHAQLVQHDNGVITISDMGSRNGTFVNGRAIRSETVLRAGDRVQLGNTTLPWEKYFRLSRGGLDKNLWWLIGGGIAASVAIFVFMIVALFDVGNRSERNFEFTGPFPPAREITIIENGESHEIRAIPGHILIFFRDGTPHSTARRLIEQHGGKIIEQIPEINYYLAQVQHGNENNFIEQMRPNPNVRYVFLNMAQMRPGQNVGHAPANIARQRRQSNILIMDEFLQPMRCGHTHGAAVAQVFHDNSTRRNIPYVVDVFARGATFDAIQSIEVVALTNFIKNTPEEEIALINMSYGPFISVDGRRVRYYQIAEQAYVQNIPRYRQALMNYRNTYKHVLRFYAETFQGIRNLRTNFIVTKSSGNEGMWFLDQIFDALPAHVIGTLQNHMMIVNSHYYGVSDADLRHHGRIELQRHLLYSNNAQRKHPLLATIDRSEIFRQRERPAWDGTSFAAPQLLGWIDRIITEFDCLNAQDVLEIIRIASPPHPLDPLSFDSLRAEAERRCQVEEEPTDFLITATSAGPIRIGMTVNDVLRTIPNSRVRVEERHGWWYCGEEVEYFFFLYIDGRKEMALTVEDFSNSRTRPVVSITILSNRYRTERGIGVGSTHQELTNTYRISEHVPSGDDLCYIEEVIVGWIIVMRVPELNANFSILGSDLPDGWWRTHIYDPGIRTPCGRYNIISQRLNPNIIPRNTRIHTITIGTLPSFLDYEDRRVEPPPPPPVQPPPSSTGSYERYIQHRIIETGSMFEPYAIEFRNISNFTLRIRVSYQAAALFGPGPYRSSFTVHVGPQRTVTQGRGIVVFHDYTITSVVRCQCNRGAWSCQCS